MGSKKRNWKKIGIIVAIVIVASMLINALGSGENEDKEIKKPAKTEQKQDNKKSYTALNLKDVKPDSGEFSTQLKEVFGDNIDIKYKDRFLYIGIKSDNLRDGKNLVKHFALQGAEMLSTIKGNTYIDEVQIEEIGKLTDSTGNASEGMLIRAMYSMKIINDTDFKNWINILYQKDNFTKFYTNAENYQMLPSLFQGLKPEIQNAMKK